MSHVVRGHTVLTLAVAGAISVAVAVSVAGAVPAPPAPVRGGVLRVAHTGEAPTIDLQWTTGAPTQDVAIHIFEGLFALSSRYEPKPLLVERWAATPDRRIYTFSLRRGLFFHHGREMTSADVVASLQRWGRIAARGRELFANVVTLTASDSYTVEMRLRDPNALVPLALAISSQGAVIYPKDVIDEAGTGPIKRFIGTGPYRFVEHVPDVRVRLERFDRYLPRDDPADGQAGKRVAYLDGIDFLPVPDASVRISGVVRGDYDFAHSVPSDEFARLSAIRAVRPLVITTPQWIGFMFNHRSPLTGIRALRRAVVAALDEEPILQGTFGPRQFWRITPSFFPREHPLYSEAGAEIYRRHDLTDARRLLAEAGYTGRPIRWMVSGEMPHHFSAATIAKAQLERVGLVIDLQVMDFATMANRRARPDGWDVFTATFGFVPDPAFLLPLQPAFPGWYDDREMQALMELLRRHADPAVRLAIWQRAQRRFYEDAVAVRLGDWFPLLLHRAELQGEVGGPGTFHWNAWMER